MIDRQRDRCAKCDRTFDTDREWLERHFVQGTVDQPLTPRPVHVDCCPICHPGATKAEAPAD